MIGFSEAVEKRPGVWVQSIEEHLYSGDFLKRAVRHVGAESVNDSVSIPDQISILADPYARNHVGSMKYVKWMGTAWKITDISMPYPRLILTLGGPYNGAKT